MLCRRCQQPLSGQKTVYCSIRCGKLYLKSLYRKRRRGHINSYARSYRANNPDKIRAQQIRYNEKRGIVPKIRAPRATKEPRVHIISCRVCPNGEFLSRRSRKKCPIHNEQTPTKLRFQVLQRDNFTCRYCGRSAPSVVLHVDHVVARKIGGVNEYDNLVTSCVECNIGKGANTINT